MFTSIESRLWLAVHLLYPSSSQAFDVYQAIVLQSEEALEKDNRSLVFFKLISIFEKIPAVSLNLSFYEFEFEEIDQWKIIYKNSQKTQLLIFIGVLIFELKIDIIAPYVKLSNNKAQFLFHQMFKKLAQNDIKIKYSDQLSFKKHNDNKISYLFTYENLIEYCLGQLSDSESDKVKMGLELYPILQTTKDEYLKIVNQIQNLRVQRSNSVGSKSKITLVKTIATADLKTVNPIFYKNKKIIAVTFFSFIVIALIIFQQSGVLSHLNTSEKTVVMHKAEKKPLLQIAQPEIALESLPLPTVAVQVPTQNINQEKILPAAEKVNVAEVKVTNIEIPKEVQNKAVSGLFRGSLRVKDLNETNKKMLAKIVSLGAKKAGEVELGWLKSDHLAYYHFTIPTENIEEANKFYKQLGHLEIKYETHPRLIPAGNKRFIIEVKAN